MRQIFLVFSMLLRVWAIAVVCLVVATLSSGSPENRRSPLRRNRQNEQFAKDGLNSNGKGKSNGKENSFEKKNSNRNGNSDGKEPELAEEDRRSYVPIRPPSNPDYHGKDPYVPIWSPSKPDYHEPIWAPSQPDYHEPIWPPSQPDYHDKDPYVPIRPPSNPDYHDKDPPKEAILNGAVLVPLGVGVFGGQPQQITVSVDDLRKRIIEKTKQIESFQGRLHNLLKSYETRRNRNMNLLISKYRHNIQQLDGQRGKISGIIHCALNPGYKGCPHSHVITTGWDEPSRTNINKMDLELLSGRNKYDYDINFKYPQKPRPMNPNTREPLRYPDMGKKVASPSTMDNARDVDWDTVMSQWKNLNQMHGTDTTGTTVWGNDGINFGDISVSKNEQKKNKGSKRMVRIKQEQREPNDRKRYFPPRPVFDQDNVAGFDKDLLNRYHKPDYLYGYGRPSAPPGRYTGWPEPSHDDELDMLESSEMGYDQGDGQLMGYFVPGEELQSEYGDIPVIEPYANHRVRIDKGVIGKPQDPVYTSHDGSHNRIDTYLGKDPKENRHPEGNEGGLVTDPGKPGEGVGEIVTDPGKPGKGVGEIVTDPRKFEKGVGEIVTDPGKPGEGVGEIVTDPGKHEKNGGKIVFVDVKPAGGKDIDVAQVENPAVEEKDNGALPDQSSSVPVPLDGDIDVKQGQNEDLVADGKREEAGGVNVPEEVGEAVTKGTKGIEEGDSPSV